MTHSPFRVVVTLATPACINPDLTLDAILAAALYRLDEDLERAHERIPLKNTDGVWHGSTVEFLDGEFSHQPYVAKLAGNDFDPAGYSGQTNRKGRVTVLIGGGDFSPQIRNLRTFIGRVAFNGCGDPEQVRVLLESLPGIGKNVRQGLGRVADIAVEIVEKDASVITDAATPARPVPAEIWSAWGHGTGAMQLVDRVGWRPPYWDPANHSDCVLGR